MQRWRKSLNQLADGGWGDRFIEAANMRKTHEKEMRLINAKMGLLGRWWTRKEVVPKVICSHPLAVDGLLRRLRHTMVDKPAGVRDTVVSALVAASGKLTEHCQPWNTYANAVFELDFFVQRIKARGEELTSRNQRHVDRRVMGLTEKECAEIERNIKPILEGSPQEPKP